MCPTYEDCAGECEGPAIEDCNGVCGGTAVEDCNGDCEGSAEINECGYCVGGNTGRALEFGHDECGVCKSLDDTSYYLDVDCAGVCGGTAYYDDCWECVGVCPSHSILLHLSISYLCQIILFYRLFPAEVLCSLI